MEIRQLIRNGVVASAIAHLSLLALLIVYNKVHPFGRPTGVPVAVEIVTAQQLQETAQQLPEKKPATAEPPQLPQADVSAKPAASDPAAPVPQPAGAPREVQDGQPQVGSASPVPYRQPEPDLAVKYPMILALPQFSPQASSPSADDRPGEGASDPSPADISSSLIVEFRRHLKTCAKLPPSVAASDKVMIRLRTFMSPDGRLAREPVVIEGTGNLKGLDLRQSAIEALQACQPYAMLPKDRYGEWKVIDLTFTPQDFSS